MALTPIRALRVIRTWASYDMENNLGWRLNPHDIVKLCDKAIKGGEDKMAKKPVKESAKKPAKKAKASVAKTKKK